MTPPVDDPETLRRILSQTRALLLDFDGPICSVFAGIPSRVVADQLRQLLADGGHTDLPAEVAESADPFDVFRYAATISDDEARHIEAAFTAHEIEAIATAKPTPGAHELMRAWKDTGRPLAIVSNNSASAVRAYLELHKITNLVDIISARTNGGISELKPNPSLLAAAASALNLASEECTLIGDSLSDIDAAQKLGVKSIGYANKPKKLNAMVSMSPVLVVQDLSMLLAPIPDSTGG